MSNHDDLVSLRQMLDYAREAALLIQGREKSESKNDRVLHLALTRLMEILGEAATRIAPQSRSRYPNLPWRQKSLACVTIWFMDTIPLIGTFSGIP